MTSYEHIIAKYSVYGDQAVINAHNKMGQSAAQAHAQVTGLNNALKNRTGGGVAPGGFGASAGSLASSAGGFGSQLAGLGGAVAGAAVAAGVAVAVIALVKLAKAIADFTYGMITSSMGMGQQLVRQRASLKAIEGRDAKAVERELINIARMPGITPNEAQEGFVKLRSSGMGRDASFEAIRQLGNANALSGGNSESLNRAIYAISQMSSKGKLQAEELMQLTEAIPAVSKVVKDAFGTTDRDELAKRSISGKEAVTALVAAMAGLEKVADNSANTYENLQVGMDRARMTFGAGILEGAQSGMAKFGETISKLVESGALETIGEQIGAAVGSLFDTLSQVDWNKAADGIGGVMNAVVDLTKVFIGAGIGLIKAAMAFANNPITRWVFGVVPGALMTSAVENMKLMGSLTDGPARPKSKLGEEPKPTVGSVVDGAVDKLRRMQVASAEAERSNLYRGGNPLQRAIVGGGDIGRWGVTSVELGTGNRANPTVVVRGGRELEAGVRRIVLETIEGLSGGGAFARA
jgi:tape measure domain-containing protein